MRMARLSRMEPPEGDLPQILHLAELLMQLVGQRRLTVLPAICWKRANCIAA